MSGESLSVLLENKSILIHIFEYSKGPFPLSSYDQACSKQIEGEGSCPSMDMFTHIFHVRTFDEDLRSIGPKVDQGDVSFVVC